MTHKDYVEHDVTTEEGIIIEEVTATQVDRKSILNLYKTSKIELISDEIEIFRNQHGKETPFLLVGKAKMDNNYYGALFDTITKKGYIVGLEYKNGILHNVRDLDGIFSDEEWVLMNEFFQQHHIFERNRIFQWVWNSMINPMLNNHIPAHILEKWGIDPYTFERIKWTGK